MVFRWIRCFLHWRLNIRKSRKGVHFVNGQLSSSNFSSTSHDEGFKGIRFEEDEKYKAKMLRFCLEISLVIVIFCNCEGFCCRGVKKMMCFVCLQKVRFSTSVLFSVSLGLEMLTPFFPNYFLLFATMANIGKSIALAAYLATSVCIYESARLYL